MLGHIKDKIAKIRAALPVPAWVGAAIGTIQTFFTGFHWIRKLFEFAEHAQFAKDVLVGAGVTIPVLVSMVSSPLFGVGLVVLSVTYGVTVSEHRRIASRFPFTATAWAVVSISAVLMLAVLMFLSFTAQSGVGRIAEFYTDQHTDRRLTDADKINIKREIKASGIVLPSLTVATVGTPEALQYATDFLKAFHDAGLNTPNYVSDKKISPTVIPAAMPDARGPSIVVDDADKPPPLALQFQEILKKAGIVATIQATCNCGDQFYFAVGYK